MTGTILNPTRRCTVCGYMVEGYTRCRDLAEAQRDDCWHLRERVEQVWQDGCTAEYGPRVKPRMNSEANPPTLPGLHPPQPACGV